jgi:hypothetical protein
VQVVETPAGPLRVDFNDPKIKNKTLHVVLATSSRPSGSKSITQHVDSQQKKDDPQYDIELKVQITRRDAQRDLATLDFIERFPNGKYFIGASSKRRLNALGCLVGYPSYETGQPSTKVDASPTTAYTSTNRVSCFAISANIRKGFSGGPFIVLDEGAWKVMGIAQKGSVQETGHDECLDVVELDKWLLHEEDNTKTTS